MTCPQVTQVTFSSSSFPQPSMKQREQSLKIGGKNRMGQGGHCGIWVPASVTTEPQVSWGRAACTGYWSETQEWSHSLVRKAFSPHLYSEWQMAVGSLDCQRKGFICLSIGFCTDWGTNHFQWERFCILGRKKKSTSCDIPHIDKTLLAVSLLECVFQVQQICHLPLKPCPEFPGKDSFFSVTQCTWSALLPGHLALSIMLSAYVGDLSLLPEGRSHAWLIFAIFIGLSKVTKQWQKGRIISLTPVRACCPTDYLNPI